MARKLEISHLGKTFGDLQALADINLAVTRGEFISVVGPSGCGKTTFLRMHGRGAARCPRGARPRR
jgi:ABC-type Fe3+/spermidine/putrescine transport system ATPase subunit